MWVKNYTLDELKALVEKAIERHGGDKKIYLFDYKGTPLETPQVVEFHGHKGNWLEICPSK